MTLYYFAQRGQFAGCWVRVPLQHHFDQDELYRRLTARGRYLTVAFSSGEQE